MHQCSSHGYGLGCVHVCLRMLDKSPQGCLQRGVSPVYFIIIRSMELTFNLLDKFQVSSYGYRNSHQDVTQPIAQIHLNTLSDIRVVDF